MSAVSAVSPILLHEFATFLLRCRPPNGWPSTIAVANSGGPDSTCLLFLFKALSQSPDVAGRDCKPERILSLTVDHGLQSVSSAMADVAASTAACMDVEHVTARVPWSTPPFPEVPKSGIESIARLARYHVLLNHLRARDTHILALGHHADDQQETALMRYDRKERTSLSDLAPMLSLRRWGMGVGAEGGLGFSGIHGMDRWLIRPLLGVRKDRILATCEAHGLEYVTDKTNFQPDLTPRNAIRQKLFKAGQASAVAEEACQSTKHKDGAVWPVMQSGSTDMALNVMERASRISMALDDSVTRNLGSIHSMNSSPPSTFLLPVQHLHELPRRLHSRLILRILRYVSPFPWGSPQAESGRSSDSIRLILRTLLQPGTAKRLSFVAGSWVQWTPVVIRADGKIVKRDQLRQGAHERRAWLVERQLPFKYGGAYRADNMLVDLTKWIHEKVQDDTAYQATTSLSWIPFHFGTEKHTIDQLATLDLDATAYDPVSDTLRRQFLWDNRFLLDFDIAATRAYLKQMDDPKLQVSFDPLRHCLPTLHFAKSEGLMTTCQLPFVRAAFIRPLGGP